MTKWIFISKPRIVLSSIIAVLIEFYAFNFVSRNIRIIATRSLGRQILDYILNFVVFFIVIYLIFSFLAFLRNKIRK